MLESLPRDEAVAPSIWPLEVANALLIAERRQRLTHAISGQYVELVLSPPIVMDEHGAATVLRQVRSLARDQDISAYAAA